ncbi:MAG: anthranilate phosphoribosyltransferase, partial [Candidatus Zixiibacteriota bacterium]
MKNYIKKVIEGRNLSQDEALSVMETIMQGEATPAQIAGLLVALKLKGEKAEEVAGFAQAMRKYSVKIKLSDKNAVDGCGTGGDGKQSFNLSTAASIVAAAAGVTVAKHGNRSVSSSCGSADLLEATGGNIDPGADVVEENINKIGFGFVFAPRFHPAMKYAAAPRKELGVRTVFNILGPLTNPADVKRQIIGVYDKKLMDLLAGVIQILGAKHVLIVHSRDGLDEFSVSAPTDYVELRDGEKSTPAITPLE